MPSLNTLRKRARDLFLNLKALVIFSFMCCLLSVCYFLFTLSSFQENQAEANRLCKKLEEFKRKNEEEERLMHQLKTADRYYIDKYLESVLFHESEIKRLQALVQASPEEESLKKRLDFLKNGANQLRFVETQRHRAELIQEVEEQQQHPIEVNLEDLKKLLARIEITPIGPYEPGLNPPQIFIKNFELYRKPLNPQEETFVINMQLVKREMIHEK